MSDRKMCPEVVNGYQIKKSIVFDNNRGFALGENPKQVQPFVTWQFTEEDGRRDYYWGHYAKDSETAEKDYTTRITDYQRMFGVSERVPHKSIADQLRDGAKQADKNNSDHQASAKDNGRER